VGCIGRGSEKPAHPQRALQALDSFRQLILDAQAMMDPDFAGKLSADVAAGAEWLAGRRRGHGIRVWGQTTADPASADSAVSFDFGAGDSNQLPLA